MAHRGRSLSDQNLSSATALSETEEEIPTPTRQDALLLRLNGGLGEAVKGLQEGEARVVSVKDVPEIHSGFFRRWGWGRGSRTPSVMSE